MRKINRKRLNNSGFTLIELLAVVVILAVVMGIALTSVLSSMNKARSGALSDSATSIVQGINTKYTESLVDGVPNKVYSDVSEFVGYDFSKTAVYYLDKKLAGTFNISESTYVLGDYAETSGGITTVNTVPTTEVNSSLISFDAVTGKFVVCLVANKSGNNYVAANVTDTSKRTVTLNGTTYTFANDEMFACSNGTKSW